MRLERKVAIVTGGGAGFGEGISRRFAAEGARVIVNDVNEEDGRRVADAVGEAGGEARFVHADVSSDADTGRLVAAAVDRYGRLDIMVNNAGVPQRAQPMESVTEDEFDRIFAVNVKALYWSAKHTVPLMRQAGGGCIIHTASTAAISPRPGLVWYNGSKGAVNTITQAMAVELAPDRIRVNAVCPVAGETRMLAEFLGGEVTPEMHAKFMSTVPLGRLSQPEDVANAVLFLASDDAEFLTGVCLPVDGGADHLNVSGAGPGPPRRWPPLLSTRLPTSRYRSSRRCAPADPRSQTLR